MEINFNKILKSVQKTSEREFDDEDEKVAAFYLEAEAKNFVMSFRWCLSVSEIYYGFSIFKYFGVFLVKISPSPEEIDEWLWVLVGDIPPAYLVCENAVTPSEAVNGYIYEMNLWVQAVRRGESTSELIPVNGRDTLENAEQLHSRLEFLKNYFSNSENRALQ